MKIYSLNSAHKYQNINFNGLKEINSAINNFSNDLLAEIDKNTAENNSKKSFPGSPWKKPISLDQIQIIAKKYIPNIKVKVDKSQEYATCVVDFYNQRNRYDLNTPPRLLLKIPEFSPQFWFNKGQYIAVIVHEMLHAFQQTDKEYSFINIHNEYLRNHLISDYKRNDKLLSSKFPVDKYIHRMLKHIELMNNTALTNDDISSYIDAEKLLKSKDKIKEIFKQMLSSDFSTLKRKKIKFDWDFIKKNMLWFANVEIAAYRKEQDIYSHFSEENDISSDVFAFLHNVLADAIKEVEFK